MSKIELIGNLKIITKDNHSICLKKNCDSKLIEKYKYLKSKDFQNFIETKIVNGYDVRDYIEEVNISKEDKLNELMYVIAMLHIKTTHYKTISIERIKDFYEKTTSEIINTKKYYENIFDDNVSYLYLKPSIFLLIKNISLILTSLDYSKLYLDNWYKIVKDKRRKRVVLNHNNLKLSNFITGDRKYLINWDNSLIDYPIYDICSLLKNNFYEIDMKDMYDIYNSKYRLQDEEKYLLYSKLLIIDKLELSKSELLNTKIVKDKINYLIKINEFLKDCVAK